MDKLKVYATAILCDLPKEPGSVRPFAGYTTAYNEDEARGKVYTMIQERYGLPILSINLCRVPTEDIVSCSCESEYDLEEHY